MIARTLRTLAEWLRNRRAAARRANMLRAESEMMLDVAHEMRGMSDISFDLALTKPEGSAERYRLEFEAHALACASMAWISKAGGDDETAKQHMDTAEWWALKAQQHDMRGLEMEASHA